MEGYSLATAVDWIKRIPRIVYLWLPLTPAVLVFLEVSRQSGTPPPVPFLMLFACVALSAGVGGIAAGAYAGAQASAYIIFAYYQSFGPAALTGSPLNAFLGISVILFTSVIVGVSRDRAVALNAELQASRGDLERYGRELEGQVDGSSANLAATIQKLGDSEKRYRALVENTPEGIIVFNRDRYRVADFNKKALSLLSTDAENLTDLGGEALLALLANYVNQSSLRELRRLLGDGPREPRETLEIQFFLPGRERQTIELRAVRIADGNLLQIGLMDITRLKQARRAAHIGNWEYSLVTGESTWSDEVFRLLELDPQSAKADQNRYLALLHPDDLEMAEKVYRQALEDRRCYDLVLRLRMQGGVLKYVKESGQIFADQQGNPIRSAGTLQDLTELMRTSRSRRSESAAADAAPPPPAGDGGDSN